MKRSSYHNLIQSTSISAQDIHTTLSTHPAAKYVKMSNLYNELYPRELEECCNLYVARCKTALELLAVMDEVAFILKLVNTPIETALPENAVDEMLFSLGYESRNITIQKRLGNMPRSVADKEAAALMRSKSKSPKLKPLIPPKNGSGKRVIKASDETETMNTTLQTTKEKYINHELNAWTNILVKPKPRE